MSEKELKNRLNNFFDNTTSKKLDGLSYSSDSFFFDKNKVGKNLIIVRDNYEAERLYKELNFLSKFKEREIILIPGTEEMPYDMVDSDKFLSSSKNYNLIKYLNSDSKDITVITTIKNFKKKIIHKEILKKNTIIIKKTNSINIQEIKEKLTNIGYTNSPQVNFSGEFSIRGSIIDIFPGGYNLPIRIDLDDINIETIKFFNVENQITFENAEDFRIYIAPMNNVVFNEENIINFRKKFREIFPGNPNNNEIYSSVSNNIIPQGINNFFPLFYKDTSFFLDYFHDINNIYIYDDIFARISDYNDDIEKRFFENSGNNENFLNPDFLFFKNEFLLEEINKKKPYEINKNKLLDKDSYNFNISAVPDISFKPYLDRPINDLLTYISNMSCVILCCDEEKKITQYTDIFKTHNLRYEIIENISDVPYGENKLYIIHGFINESFKIDELKISLINSQNIVKNKIKQQSSKKSSKSTFFIDQLKNLEIGSPVVHEIHGVGRYGGLKYLDTNGLSNEYLTIHYEDNDKLYVPVSTLHLVNKYNTVENETAPLHKLGGFSWSNAKKKATKKAYDIAAELLEINAKRAAKKTSRYNIDDFEYEQFSNEFIYEETEDQAKAIDDVIKDLTSEKIMDRLVCGDVGFGKTEIALRAAFVCASNFKQVVILTPTTLLAEQHEKTFIERFKNWPFNIKCLSRFKSKKDQNHIISEIESGKCNIVIGTHRAIQKDINYKSLGLLIIDEEQKFGVKHKEFLKKIRDEVNVLTLTATPIPRTLNMSLGGLKDLSIIATSPENRMPIKTYVTDWKKSVIRDALVREINRGGQIFFLHNRINDINLIYNELQDILPSCSIKVAHAQMSSSQLEKIILEFYNKKFNVLLSTTIIENGIDVANANTIIINRADKFGLSQLHQIRGRVGRSSRQAYCYLLVQDRNYITDNAKKRLLALENMEDLGSGFSIASRDLEIRGAGALLGESQSGEIQEIGFSLYNRILSKAISSLKSGKIPNFDNALDTVTEIDINEIAIIPSEYIDDVNQRLIMYKKIANTENSDELDNITIELINRFGNLPIEVKNLIDITKMKIKYSDIGIKRLLINKNSLKISFQKNANINHEKLINFINSSQNNVSFTKDETLVYKREFNDIREKKIIIADIIGKLT